MTIALIGAGGLFTRLGRCGKLINLANIHQAALPAAYDSLFDQFTSQPDRVWVRDLLDGYEGLLNVPVGGLTLAQADAQRILFEMVLADNPAAATSVPSAVQEVIRQMGVAVASVPTCTIGVASTLVTGTQGDGTIVTGAKRGDGLIRQNVIAETATNICEIDSYSGNATAGQEQFRFTGASLTADRLSYNWPDGSGASWPFLAIDAAAAADANGNLLTNSDFEDAAVANTPDNWVIAVGSAGTEVFVTTSAPYYGTSCLQFAGSAAKTEITQTFGDDSAGTSPIPLPSVNYALSFRIKVTGGPAAGVLVVEWTNAAGTVTTDEAGTSNSVTINLTAASSSWALPDEFTITAGSLDWRLPKVVPTGLKIRLRLSTALSVGSSLFIDHMALAQMQVPYAGGPNVAVFGGAIAFARGDGWTIADTNNRNSATYLATWNGLMDRLFQMRENGLQLPYSGAPTIADSLITS